MLRSIVLGRCTRTFFPTVFVVVGRAREWPSQSQNESPIADAPRPTYIKVHRKYLDPATLDHYGLPWDIVSRVDSQGSCNCLRSKRAYLIDFWCIERYKSNDY